ncbi:hypothetical protein C5F59_018375 [Streptomyces sp. QL37]|uniref:hypothetical protein n=1 Tax=Streptomyces sp. QL37 TaxID=2093747 RepID=UPI00137500E4
MDRGLSGVAARVSAGEVKEPSPGDARKFRLVEVGDPVRLVAILACVGEGLGRLGGGPVVKRWAYEPDRWVELLTEHGFTSPTAQILPAPPGPRKVGTLLVRASG